MTTKKESAGVVRSLYLDRDTSSFIEILAKKEDRSFSYIASKILSEAVQKMKRDRRSPNGEKYK